VQHVLSRSAIERSTGRIQGRGDPAGRIRHVAVPAIVRSRASPACPSGAAPTGAWYVPGSLSRRPR